MARHALLIGVSEFADKRLARLNAPTNDVLALRDILQDNARGGFDTVTLSLNDDFVVMRDHLSRFFHDRAPDDLLLLYYSGHGILGRGNRLFLATADSNLDMPHARSIAAREIREFIEECRAEQQIVILDCCHSGAFAEYGKAAASPPAVTEDTFAPTNAGLYVLTAADALQFAWDGAELRSGDTTANRFSQFTSWLVEGLAKGEAAPDDEQITIDALYHYLFRRARAAGAAATPQRFVQGGVGDLVVSHNPLAGEGQIDPAIRAALGNADRLVRLGSVTDLALQMRESAPVVVRAARLVLERHLPREHDYAVRISIKAALQQAAAARQAEEKRPRAEVTRQAEEERPRAEAARQAEEERKRAEAARQAEEEKKRAEAARRAEEERKRAEAARRAEEEKKRAEAARRAEAERKRAEAARRAEEEKKRVEAARRAEAERKRAEAARAVRAAITEAFRETPREESALPKPWAKRWIALAGGIASALAVVIIFAVFALHIPPSPSPIFVILDIRTTPPGATLHVDGKSIGTAPATLETKPGKHIVQASLAGYQSTSLAVDLQPGQNPPLALTLAPLAAALDIRTAPSEATLQLDGKSVGTAPAVLKIKPGKHVVQASLAGYQSTSLAVDLQPGQNPPLALTLAPLAAALDIRTTPTGAAISIDGKPVGAAPLVQKIAPGKYLVQADLDNYQPKSLSVSLRPGQTLPLDLTLLLHQPDFDGIIKAAMSASTIKIDDRWIELYGIADPTLLYSHIKAVLGYVAPARGRVACYRKAPKKYQCYSGGQDLALSALRDGIARLAPDAPQEYREALRRAHLIRPQRHLIRSQ